MILQGLGEGFGLTEIGHDARMVAGRVERCPHGKPEVDGLLTGCATLRQMLEGSERLLEIKYGFVVGGPRHGFRCGLLEIRNGLVP